MGMMRKLNAGLILLLATIGCTKAPDEAAPVQAGDYLEYRFTESNGSIYSSKIQFQPDGKEVLITADPPGAFESETADVALLHGRRMLKMYRLGQLWLPSKTRNVGDKVPAGDVKQTQTWNRWPVIMVLGNAGADKRYYHADTGYLVGMDLAGRGTTSLQAKLVSSSIPQINP